MNATSAWNLYHGALPLVYLAAVLVITMVSQQPVLVAMSFAASVAYNFVLSGARSMLLMLAWELPMLLLIACANPLFSASGSTELFRIGPRALYAESLLYGFTTGGMLTAVMTWFSCGNRMLSSDQALLVGAKVFPTVSLMLSMVLRLVPQFLRRGHAIADAQKACTSGNLFTGKPLQGSGDEKTHAETRFERFIDKDGKHSRLGGAARQVSVLMSWSMEDSLQTADAMRARAWGCGARRTSYSTRRFAAQDALLALLVAVLSATSLACAVSLSASFAFYPVVSGWGSTLGYAPFALLLAVPFVLELKEWLHWR